MSLTLIQQVRLEVQDNEAGFYFLSDEEIEYLLDKYKGNVARASMDAARIILMKLSQRGDETVDIMSIKGSAAANAYRLALELYINNPTLNPLNKDVTIYVGGISRSDMCKNDMNLDTNIVRAPNKDYICRDSFVVFNPWPKIGCWP